MDKDPWELGELQGRLSESYEDGLRLNESYEKFGESDEECHKPSKSDEDFLRIGVSNE